MWDLDYRKYEIVHFQNEQVLPWIVNQDSLPRMQQLSSLISDIKSHLTSGYLKDTYFALQEIYTAHLQSQTRTVDLSRIIENIGLKTILTPNDAFLDYPKFNQYKADTSVILLTEKNLYPQLIGKGSSRHALGVPFQFKGIGRNPLAHSEDYYHSWGGFVSRDSLRSLVSDRIVMSRTKLGCMQTQALFRYKENLIDKTPLVLALRECDGYRLSQINPTFISPMEKLKLKDHLINRFNLTDLKKILERIVDHYVHAFSQGVVHRSVSQENLMLDGRFVDTDSIEFTDLPECCPFYIKVSSHKIDRVLEKGTSLESVLTRGENAEFSRTWMHDLKLMCEMTATAFQTITGVSYDWEVMFHAACENYLPDAHRDWAVFSHLESFARKFCVSSHFPVEEFEWSQQMNDLCRDAVCTGSFYDYFTHRVVHTFSIGGDDLRKSGMNKLLKLDLSLWGKELSWSNAFENWALIQKAAS